MSQSIPDSTIIAAVSGRFPELLEGLTCFGWIWIRAAAEVMKLEGEQQLADFVCDLADHYRALPEIPDNRERLLFALVAQRCHLDMITKALAVARDASGLHPSFTLWRQAGSLPGRWQSWSFTRQFLSHPVCLTHGEFPDQLGLAGYVKDVEQHYLQSLIPVESA